MFHNERMCHAHTHLARAHARVNRDTRQPLVNGHTINLPAFLQQSFRPSASVSCTAGPPDVAAAEAAQKMINFFLSISATKQIQTPVGRFIQVPKALRYRQAVYGWVYPYLEI